MQQKVTLVRRYFVFFAVTVANLLSFAAAIGFCWSATIIPHLTSNDTAINPLPKPLTTLESSWIVSILMIGCLVGPLIGGILIAKLGKKNSILLLGILAFTGHLILAFATPIWVFLIARFVMGLTLGCSFGVMASYVGDIAEDKNRGLLGSFTPVFMSLGGLYVYTVGPFVSLRLFSLLNLIPFIVRWVMFGLLVPDTPFDLLQKNATQEARNSLALYRANMLLFAVGAVFTWASTILPRLQSNDTSINPLPELPTTLESSWIVSISMIGSITGPLIGGFLLSKLGKKKFILLLAIPLFIGHLMIAFATTVWVILIARFITGLSLGCANSVMASYTGDIAGDHNRGLLGSISTVFLSLGGLAVYVVGPYTSVKVFSLLNVIPLVLLFAFFGLFVPNTPFDLLKKNSVEDARKSLAFYRGKTVTEVDKELEILKKSINDTQEKNNLNPLEQLKMVYHSKPLFRGLKLIEIILLSNALTGMGAVANYYQTIFAESSGSLESIYSVMIIGVVTVFATVFTSQVVEKLGRKLLLLIGYTFMGLALISLATYFLLKTKDFNIEPIGWLPLASLISYTLAYNVQGGIPWILLTDIFPSNVIDVCSIIASVTIYILAFSVSLTFPYARDVLGYYGVFYLFGFSMLGFVVYAYFFIPETKGKSVEEVQEMLAAT